MRAMLYMKFTVMDLLKNSDLPKVCMFKMNSFVLYLQPFFSTKLSACQRTSGCMLPWIPMSLRLEILVLVLTRIQRMCRSREMTLLNGQSTNIALQIQFAINCLKEGLTFRQKSTKQCSSPTLLNYSFFSDPHSHENPTTVDDDTATLMTEDGASSTEMPSIMDTIKQECHLDESEIFTPFFPPGRIIHLKVKGERSW